MIEHDWTVVCSRTIVDPDSRNATLVDVIEQLNLSAAARFPVVIPVQMDIVSLWYRSNIDVAERGQGRIALVNPAGEEHAEEILIDVSEYPRARTISRSGGIAVSGPGTYRFRIEVRED